MLDWVIDSNRLERASSAKLTPVSIDRNTQSAEFIGSTHYHTTLSDCNCTDFIRLKEPCKHMYRLALELGLINGQFQSNVSSIPVADADAISLSEMVSLLESLPTPAQKRYRAMLKTRGWKDKVFRPTNTNIHSYDALEAVSLISAVPDGYIIAQACRKYASRVNTYLMRKFDSSTNEFTPDVPFARFPSGARYENSLLFFPDDEVTKLLNKYNCNRLYEPWKASE